MSSLPLQFLLATIAGWMTRDQHKVVAYLLAENALLRAMLRGKRIRFSDAHRRKLARAAKALGRRELAGLNTLVTPETLLRWYRRLVGGMLNFYYLWEALPSAILDGTWCPHCCSQLGSVRDADSLAKSAIPVVLLSRRSQAIGIIVARSGLPRTLLAPPIQAKKAESR